MVGVTAQELFFRSASVDSTNVAQKTFDSFSALVGTDTVDSNSCYDSSDVDFAAEVLLVHCVGTKLDAIFVG